ncbi:xanthine dehydrogenase family protein molybdopterin-binding subunit [Actinokineospora bangkokensis]|uniref:Isoquinoline 1-oxidoreductase n=1 Tax=Actinokineospora bangkokensis TaxID=1193682 RepID=A0A1Q9LRT1_9PSEU|nr:molybdopterin cofactor-binding domain-containing protein [Actinokineospora bangkokensis]OLR94729.1 isoquinoline 1-oxidoreductase [Actinokineospora bangkokensis]
MLALLVAAPTLTVAGELLSASPDAEAAIPSLPEPAEILDLGDVLILAGTPTAHMLVLRVDLDGTATLRLPRAEVGQGITTAAAMLVAEELDLPLARVRVELDDARPELLFNQLTGSSNTIRSVYGPIRQVAANARARLVAAAAARLRTGSLSTRDGEVVAADGRRVGYGELAAAAAEPSLVIGIATPKRERDFRVVGTPTSRVDARAMVTGQQKYTLDIQVPGALPTMVRRPPTINGTVRAVRNEAAVRAMPGVVDVAVVPTGVAVLAETFGQALDAKEALEVDWGPGTVDAESDSTIRAKLRAAAPGFGGPPLLGKAVDAEFDFAFVSHAPMETNSAIADVRADRAEVWSALKSPIQVKQQVAEAVGLPADKVVVHVVQGGGSFGRRLFGDAAVEAARISKAAGRPVKLMWSRIDDMRHGRARAASHHKLRAVHALGAVVSIEHRVASVETDFGHGVGDAITAEAAQLPVAGNLTFANVVFLTTVKSPYNLGVTTRTLTEVPLGFHTGSWRSVYSASARGAEEVVVDEIARALGRDPVALRRELLKSDRQRAVLAKAAAEGQWGRALPAGFAQGIGFHDEYKSCTAYLVEVDARDPRAPRVVRATIAVDVGRAVNPRGLESQMLGGLTDGISTVLRAGLHIDRGLPLEGSYSQFHYARQKDSPTDVRVFVLPGTGDPGGAGELGVPAAVGAIANAYARATGTRPRSFPINFPVDFEPFPR